MWIALAAFVPAATLIILVPGPDTLIVLRSIVRGGRSHGWATAAGTLTGLAVWAAVAAVGLAAVLRASETAYAALRIAGACYLGYLGLQSLRSLRRRQPGDKPEPTERKGILGTGYGAGVITNLLNPKVGVFFVTFLPGFVPHGYPVGVTSLLFGAVFVALTLGYFVLLLTFAARLTQWMRTPRVRRRLDAVTGAVLIGFGVRLAAEP
jgi:threonine/homoserine/homoserine lactone efflux protein